MPYQTRTITYDDWDKPVVFRCRCCNQVVRPQKMGFQYTTPAGVITSEKFIMGGPCGRLDYWYSEEYRKFCAGTGSSGPEYEIEFINGRYYIEDVAPPKPRCECGAHKTGSKMHSHWCPMVHERTK